MFPVQVVSETGEPNHNRRLETADMSHWIIPISSPENTLGATKTF